MFWIKRRKSEEPESLKIIQKKSPIDFAKLAWDKVCFWNMAYQLFVGSVQMR